MLLTLSGCCAAANTQDHVLQRTGLLYYSFY